MACGDHVYGVWRPRSAAERLTPPDQGTSTSERLAVLLAAYSATRQSLDAGRGLAVAVLAGLSTIYVAALVYEFTPNVPAAGEIIAIDLGYGALAKPPPADAGAGLKPLRLAAAGTPK